MSEPDRYAVFGHPIQHSKSPLIHSAFAKQTRQNLSYTAEDVPPEAFDDQVDQFFSEGGFGLNCTVPLKELAFRKADLLSTRAQRSGAVNTLKKQSDGSLLGENTDGMGLVKDLQTNLSIDLRGLNILILGAGGASRGIVLPLLEQMPASIMIANRTKPKATQLADHFTPDGPVNACGLDELHEQQFDLILNATAASLSHQLPPLPDDLLVTNGICYDLAYSNQATPFVVWGQQHGARLSVDGLGMLVEQAAEAFYLWRNIRPRTAEVIRLLRP